MTRVVRWGCRVCWSLQVGWGGGVAPASSTDIMIAKHWRKVSWKDFAFLIRGESSECNLPQAQLSLVHRGTLEAPIGWDSYFHLQGSTGITGLGIVRQIDCCFIITIHVPSEFSKLFPQKNRLTLSKLGEVLFVQSSPILLRLLAMMLRMALMALGLHGLRDSYPMQFLLPYFRTHFHISLQCPCSHIFLHFS